MWAWEGYWGDPSQGRASEPPQGLCDPFGNECCLASINQSQQLGGTPRPFGWQSPVFFSQTFLYFATSSFPKTELVLLPLLKNLLEPCGLACYTWLFVVKLLPSCLPHLPLPPVCSHTPATPDL